jgi:hypothetical protein
MKSLLITTIGLAAACLAPPAQAAPLKTFHPGEFRPDHNGVHVNAIRY